LDKKRPRAYPDTQRTFETCEFIFFLKTERERAEEFKRNTCVINSVTKRGLSKNSGTANLVYRV